MEKLWVLKNGNRYITEDERWTLSLKESLKGTFMRMSRLMFLHDSGPGLLQMISYETALKEEQEEHV